MQLEKVAAKKEVNKKEQAIIDTLQLTSEVCTQRHFAGLFHKMREFMPKYFGFQGCGVLLYNKESKLSILIKFFSQLDVYGSWILKKWRRRRIKKIT